MAVRLVAAGVGQTFGVCPQVFSFESLRFSDHDFQEMERLLTEDLWLSSGMPYDYSNSGRVRDPGFFLSGTAILKGSLDEKLCFFPFKILWTIENHHHLVGVCFKSFSNHPGQASLRTWICLRLFVLFRSIQIHLVI